jgi:D-tyrosyl-tRNA(Tyr) deacylase
MWDVEMRAVVQRVSRARVLINGDEVGAIDRGLVILLGVKHGDTGTDVEWMVDKCVNLRIFEDEQGKFNLSLLDVQGDVLVVSQFTLYGDCRKGRRPSFTQAASPDTAKTMYHCFVDTIKQTGLKVETGIFAARMDVEICNRGPVTLIIDSKG